MQHAREEEEEKLGAGVRPDRSLQDGTIKGGGGATARTLSPPVHLQQPAQHSAYCRTAATAAALSWTDKEGGVRSACCKSGTSSITSLIRPGSKLNCVWVGWSSANPGLLHLQGRNL